MLVRMVECKPQLSTDRLAIFERQYGVSLPEEYRSHLLRYNGGRPIPSCFTFMDGNERDISCVHYFYAIYNGALGNLEDLEETVQAFKKTNKRMPKHIFPIAGDEFGNQICISCSGEDYGYIYFWDHENEVDYSISNDSDYSNLYLISKSFSEFLENLFDGD